MDFRITKLDAPGLEYAKQLFLFFQVDDGVPNPVLSSDSYLLKLLSKEDFHVLVALQDDELIGGLTAYELSMYQEEINELFIYEIAVKPLYRKQGVAKALINEIRRISLEKGIKIMYVGTETDNTPAKRLYTSTGGKEEKITWFTYGE